MKRIKVQVFKVKMYNTFQLENSDYGVINVAISNVCTMSERLKVSAGVIKFY